MNQRNTLIISIGLILFTIIAGMLLWNKLPDPMASHWGANDQVNGYTSRFWGVFLLPIMTTGILLLFLAIPSIDPLKANIALFRGHFNTFIILFVAFMVYVHSMTLVWNLGYQFRFSTALLPAMGLLFIFIGQLISRVKRNFFIGIRTPWTLSSDYVWEETHRVGGKLFMAAGGLALLGAFFPAYSIFFILVPVLGAALFSVVYSYWLYQKETKS